MFFLEKAKKELIGVFRKDNALTTAKKQANVNSKPFEVTLLSEKEANDETSVIQRIMKQGLPDSIGRTGEKDYWLRDSFRFHQWPSGTEASGYYVQNHAIGIENTAKEKGIRPIIKCTALNEVLKKATTTIDDKGFEEITLGEFPRLNVEIKIFDSVMEETGKWYNILKEDSEAYGLVIYQCPEFIIKSQAVIEIDGIVICRCPEYFIKGKKVIELDGQYYPVLPVQFYVDRKNNMLISKSSLFSSPINLNSMKYDGTFETSQLYDYLNGWFIKSLVPSSEYFQAENEETENQFQLVLNQSHKRK